MSKNINTMREIKFRGKVKNVHDFRGLRIENGWVYGSLLQYPSASKICDTEEMLGWSVEVISESVGQFTGGTDKNGIEIYEGDVLQEDDGRYFTVIFDDYAFLLDCGSVSYYFNSRDLMKMSVIGNMYDKNRK